MLRHVEVPWGERVTCVCWPLGPGELRVAHSTLPGSPLDIGAGPPVPPPPYTVTHKNYGVCWGSPPLESVTQFAALHDGSVDPFYFRSVVVPTVPLRGLLGGSCIAAHGGSGVFLWPDQHVMIRWPIPCGGGWGELKSSVREFFGLCTGRRPNGAWSQPGRSLAD